MHQHGVLVHDNEAGCGFHRIAVMRHRTFPALRAGWVAGCPAPACNWMRAPVTVASTRDEACQEDGGAQ